MDEDKTITVLRHFKWNVEKLEDQWFSMPEDKKFEIGIEFNQKLRQKYPEIDDSTEAKNKGTCNICYCAFEKDDE